MADVPATTRAEFERALAELVKLRAEVREGPVFVLIDGWLWTMHRSGEQTLVSRGPFRVAALDGDEWKMVPNA